MTNKDQIKTSQSILVDGNKASKSGLSRRSALKTLGLTAAGSAAALSMPSIGNAAAAKLNLRCLIWEPYNLKEFVANFEQENDCRIDFSFFDGNSEAFNQMRAGEGRDFELVMADGHWPKTYFNNDLTQTIDTSKIPNLKNVFSWFLPEGGLKLHQTPDQSATFAIPNCWGGQGVTYNTDKIPAEEAASLRVLFDEKYAGHLVTNARYEETIAQAAILAVLDMGTIDDERPDGQSFNPYVLTDAELEETKKLLISQKKLLLTRYQDFDMLTRLLRSGQVWAGPDNMISYRALLSDYRDGKLGFKPEYVLRANEGGLGWIDTWLISAGVQDSETLELCHKWINAYLGRENMVEVARRAQLAPTVDCLDLLEKFEIEDLLMDRSEEVTSLYMFDAPSSPEKWERVWSDVEAS